MLCNVIENGKVRCFDYCGDRQTETLKEIGKYLTVDQVKDENLDEKEQLNYIHIHYS